MYRGTTPSIAVNVTGVDFGDVTEIWLTLGQFGRPVITKTITDLRIENSTIYADLTQEDTLKLRANSRTYLQIRVLLNDGTALASPVARLKVEQILQNGIMGVELPIVGVGLAGYMRLRNEH